MNNIISERAIIGSNFKIGNFCIIDEDVIIGDNVEIGNYCHLHKDVKIGNNTKIIDYVELRNNTRIGENCYVDSRVSSSGNVLVGNNVSLRYDTILAREVEVGDNTYICPRVMTNNLDTGRIQIGGAKIGKNCFIGTNTVLQHGIVLEDNVITGAMSFITKDCEANGVYIGVPAKKKEAK